MFILEHKEKSPRWQNRKIILVYMAVSIIAIAVNNIYAVFGHGVSSDAMTWMFLYPLIGGALLYLLIGGLISGSNQMVGYRVFCNLYNSGIVILTAGSFLKGILDIAGTSSSYVALYYKVGWLSIAVGLILLITTIWKSKKAKIII